HVQPIEPFGVGPDRTLKGRDDISQSVNVEPFQGGHRAIVTVGFAGIRC
ncbi:MAG: hypothetical protein ACI9OJ_004151, partial [Myxococcota bacterium]